MKRVLFLLCVLLSYQCFSQPVCRETLKVNRDKLYRNIVRNSINANLSVALSDSTEDNWQDAFWSIALINYRSPWSDNKVYSAFNDIHRRSTSFQRALLELGYAVYPNSFYQQARSLLLATRDAKIFAMCTAYILQTEKGMEEKDFLLAQANAQLARDTGNAILQQAIYFIGHIDKPIATPSIREFFQPGYLPGQVLVLSFQRKNRNYPGLVLVRDTAGNFIKSEPGVFFTVPQLARSISNLPGYLTNGNTPQGVFRMYGFDISKSSFIGPTKNIQLTMPFEYKASHYFRDTLLNDSIWNIEMYKKLLPANFQAYYPAYEAYFAGKAGRREIIAHGTTVNPEYYKNSAFYPLTPTQGCLCTKETWDEETGRLIESDQQLLSDSIEKAGGPFGYTIVIDLDDRQEPVQLADIMTLLKLGDGK